MAVSKKYQHYDQYMLKGKLRFNGFERWRYVFTGVDKNTGSEKSFFIEIYLVNPLESPKNVVIAQKSRPVVSSEDLQYALAGTISAQAVSDEYVVKPSYALVKCGMFGENGKQFNRFSPGSELVWHKKSQEFTLAGCTFAEDVLTGEVTVHTSELRDNPELLCSAGKMSWNLHYERALAAGPFEDSQKLWCPTGSKTVFAGTVTIDDDEYSVIPKKSFGYVDKSWGTELNDPYFHISSSNLTSLISGKQLTRSSFAVEGDYADKIRLHVCIEGEEVKLNLRKASQFHECVEAPADSDGEKLHWTVSVTDKKCVVDIDVFCRTRDMYVRDFEIPQGNRTLLKILSSSSGTGEIRIYKKDGENLELLEHAHIATCLCEFGKTEEVRS